MAETKKPKTETKRPIKRRTATRKGIKESSEISPAVGNPPVKNPVVEVTTAETSTVEVPAGEASAGEMPEAPAEADNAAEEIRTATKLLRSNGYLLIPYRKLGRGIARPFCAVAGLVRDGSKGLCRWLSKTHAAMKVRQEENRRVSSEKQWLDDEANRRAEIEKAEMRLAELRAEEARLKAAAEAAEKKDKSPEVKEPEVKEPEVVESAVSDVMKCAACGAELVLGARFCRKCGTRIAESIL